MVCITATSVSQNALCNLILSFFLMLSKYERVMAWIQIGFSSSRGDYRAKN